MAARHDGFQTTAWTDERVETLRAGHKAGLSASQIANQLGGITRNAVIGKVHRLGLGPIGGGRASNPLAGRLQKVGLPTPPARPKLKVFSPTQVVEVSPPRPPLVEIPERAFSPLKACEPVPFASPGCKWPVSGEGADMLCCGAKREEDGPYCAAHARVAFVPLTPVQKNLNRSLRKYVTA